ncbi:DUF6111 family protein [Hyphobacterium sp.]|uniref:DUF6111 family protein n=1 Tax=Hyphobacterium sp. TaxID=2004662 RepID=UPI003B52A7DC
MVRLAFLEMLLFLTPFIAFALWRLSMQATVEIAEHQPAPVWILSAIGGFLAAAGFVFLVFMSDTGDSEHSTYIPPRLGADGIERAEFNNQPGEAPPQDFRNFGEPSDHTVTTDLDEEEDDGDPPSPR